MTMPEDKRKHKLVVHFRDGRLLKGVTYKLEPDWKGFYLFPRDAAPGEEQIFVNFSDLKAVFFVKDYDGKPVEMEGREEEYAPEGHEIEVCFKDGEMLRGFALGHYTDESSRFYVNLKQPDNNNYTILVERESVESIKLGKVFRKKELYSLVNTPVKKLILLYYTNHSGMVTTERELAEAIGRTLKIVQRDIQSFINEGLIVREGSAQDKIKFLPVPDEETKEFIDHTIATLPAGLRLPS